uniref:Pentatricopeptide repeat-containing protein n=1 Tax=Kalanchoe fedtschenkoi TaxID=63787 RepID=A0A7N0T4V9_KALFE
MFIAYFHTHVLILGFQADVFVQTSMIDGYSSCSCLGKARQLFDKMGARNEVTWSCIITTYSRLGRCDETWAIFNEMQEKSVISWTIMMQGLVDGGDFNGLFSLFREVRLETFDVDVGLENQSPTDRTLVRVYANCCDIVYSRAAFDVAALKDVSLWTSMICGYVQFGLLGEAMHLFNNTAQEIENYIIADRLESDVRVQTSLIHLYCKCGSLDKAESAFQRVVKKDLAVWSAIMINTCTTHGMGA